MCFHGHFGSGCRLCRSPSVEKRATAAESSNADVQLRGLAIATGAEPLELGRGLAHVLGVERCPKRDEALHTQCIGEDLR